MQEHVKRYLLEKKRIEGVSKNIAVELKQFDGRLSRRIENSTEKQKTYCKIIVNRWHLLVRLAYNKQILSCRKKDRNFNLNKINEIRNLTTNKLNYSTNSEINF